MSNIFRQPANQNRVYHKKLQIFTRVHMSVYIKKSKAKTKWNLHPLLRSQLMKHPAVQSIQANKFAKKTFGVPISEP